MVGKGTQGLRVVSSLLYGLSFCAAGIIIGIFSFFIARLVQHNLGVSKDWQAVEGLAGCAVIYTALASLMVCCLGGKIGSLVLGLIGDALICGAFIAIAVLDRSGAHRRTGNVATPVGNGLSGTTGPAGVNLGLAARLNTTVFACAVAGAGLMAISFLWQFAMFAKHRSDNKYGPSPDNDYTSGSGRKRGFFGRKPRNDLEEPFGTEKEATDVPAVPVVGTAAVDRQALRNDIRPSHDTAYTGTTMGQNDNAPTKYEPPVPVAAEPASNIVSTSHYTVPGRYDPTYNPANGTTNANF